MGLDTVAQPVMVVIPMDKDVKHLTGDVDIVVVDIVTLIQATKELAMKVILYSHSDKDVKHPTKI